MFDNPKKELERLEQQLLAAEAAEVSDEEEVEELDEDCFDELIEDDIYDDELQALLCGTAAPRRSEDDGVSRRAAGFDADDYVMDTDRYVPVPKKKGIGCLTAFGIVQAIAVIGLIAWLLGRML